MREGPDISRIGALIGDPGHEGVQLVAHRLDLCLQTADGRENEADLPPVDVRGSRTEGACGIFVTAVKPRISCTLRMSTP